MSWSGYDQHGNYYKIEEDPTPEEISSGGVAILGIIGVLLCGYFIFKYWPLILGCAIASFILAAAAYFAKRIGAIPLINTLWMSAVFIAFTFLATELLVFDKGHFFATILSVVMLISEVLMAKLISFLTNLLARKIFFKNNK